MKYTPDPWDVDPPDSYQNPYEDGTYPPDPYNFNPTSPTSQEGQPVGTSPVTTVETDWLYDQSKNPPFQVPGQEWFWNGSQWSTRPVKPPITIVGTGNGSTITGPPNPYDPNDPHYVYGPNTPGGNIGTYGGGGGGGGTGGGLGGVGGAPGGYAPPGPFNFPLLDIPSYTPYADYVPEEWIAPKPEDVHLDPSYQFRFDEGMKPITNQRALAGLTRGGATMKALTKYGQNFASDEFGRIYDRAADTYDRREKTNYGAYTTNRDNYNTAYDYDVNEAKLEFEPKKTWAELQFGQNFDIWKFQNQQAFDYWNAALGASTQGSQFGNDED